VQFAQQCIQGHGWHRLRQAAEETCRAGQLGITVRTAQNHIVSVKEKLGIHEPAGLVRYAIKHGLVEPP